NFGSSTGSAIAIGTFGVVTPHRLAARRSKPGKSARCGRSGLPFECRVNNSVPHVVLPPIDPDLVERRRGNVMGAFVKRSSALCGAHSVGDDTTGILSRGSLADRE